MFPIKYSSQQEFKPPVSALEDRLPQAYYQLCGNKSEANIIIAVSATAHGSAERDCWWWWIYLTQMVVAGVFCASAGYGVSFTWEHVLRDTTQTLAQLTSQLWWWSSPSLPRGTFSTVLFHGGPPWCSLCSGSTDNKKIAIFFKGKVSKSFIFNTSPLTKKETDDRHRWIALVISSDHPDGETCANNPAFQWGTQSFVCLSEQQSWF